MQFALNHMTLKRRTCSALLDLAADLGCVGVEMRNDLPSRLFDGASAASTEALSCDKGLRILALAEIPMFNDWSETRAMEAEKLIDTAAKCGAEAAALIPRNDGNRLGEIERRQDLCTALRALKPILNDHGLFGFIEPLGFTSCNLRHKSEAVAAIDAVDGGDTFKLVHDTFHHTLAGEDLFFAGRTGIVHISGVTNPDLSFDQMRDADRGLVDGMDRLNNIQQLKQLKENGYTGPVSFEAFAPEIHDITDPKAALSRSIQFIGQQMRAYAA